MRCAAMARNWNGAIANSPGKPSQGGPTCLPAGFAPIDAVMSNTRPKPLFPHRHLLGIEGLSRPEIEHLLDMAEEAVGVSRQVEKKRSILRGRTQINLFFEASTRTQASF